MTERKAGTANATRANAKPPTATSTVGTSTSTSAPTTKSSSVLDNTKKDIATSTLARGDGQSENTSSKLSHAAESTGATAGTSRELPTSSQPDTATGRASPSAIASGGALLLPLSASAASGLGTSGSPKSEIAPEILAANQAGGTPLSRDETGDVLSGAVQAPGSEGLTPKKEKRRKSSTGEGGDISRVSSLNESSSSSAGNNEESRAGADSEVVEDSEVEEEDEEEEEYVDEEERIIAAGGMGIPIDEDGNPAPLLKELTPAYKGKKCLVLDLDETLVHSSFKVSPTVH